MQAVNDIYAWLSKRGWARVKSPGEEEKSRQENGYGTTASKD